MTLSPEQEVDLLIEAMIKKFKTNKDVLARFLLHGGMNWDRTKPGEFKVNLTPRL